MTGSPGRVLLYELNEVPWRVVDLYVDRRPSSALARMLDVGFCRTTVNEDHGRLEPWRTWPTFHKSMYMDEHGSYDLGQDVTTFRGENLWETAEKAGRSIGVFGPLQSWPAHEPANGGFYVPDTFSRDPETSPSRLTAFQKFNLKMTGANAFSSNARLSLTELAAAGWSAVRNGLRVRSLATIGRHLVQERRDERYKASRPIMQVLPTFDLFWRLWTDERPDLSIFFTNHVAAMMHRYWGDAVPEYASDESYPVDDVYTDFLFTAMDCFDRQLDIVLRAAARDETTVIVASGMGQGPISYREHHEEDVFVLADPYRLQKLLGLPAGAPGLAMYPRSSIQFHSEEDAGEACTHFASVAHANGSPIFDQVRQLGNTVTLRVDRWLPIESRITLRPVGATEPISVTAEDAGLVVRRRLGGGNTAEHIPEGIFIAVGPRAKESSTREEVSILDAAPSVLDLIGVAAAATMRGEPTLF